MNNQIERLAELRYLAWLSTKGEREAIRDGALFAGFVRDLPAEYAGLIKQDEARRYCRVTKLEAQADE